jgi:hypothetical protein
MSFSQIFALAQGKRASASQAPPSSVLAISPSSAQQNLKPLEKSKDRTSGLGTGSRHVTSVLSPEEQRAQEERIRRLKEARMAERAKDQSKKSTLKPKKASTGIQKSKQALRSPSKQPSKTTKGNSTPHVMPLQTTVRPKKKVSRFRDSNVGSAEWRETS